MNADDARRRADELFETIIGTSPEAITLSDLEGKITVVSPQTLEIHGFDSAEELLGRNAFELIAPEDRERALKNLEKTLEEGRLKATEYTLLRKDGTSFTGELSASLVRDSSGNPSSFIAITRDITERKRAEERIRLLSEAVNNSNSGIAITSPDMKLTYVNRAFCRMWGGTSQEHLGNDPMGYWDEESQEKIRSEVLPAIESGGWRGELTAISNSGITFPVELSVSAMRDEKGNVLNLMAIFEDISERKKVEQMKTDFISTAAHELRTPLAAMELGVEALASPTAGELSKEQEHFVDILGSSIERLARLASNLLDMTQIEAGTITMEKEKIDLGAVLGEVSDAFNGIVAEKGLTLKLDVPQEPVHAYVDHDRITQVLSNLINNATKFTDEGGISLSVSERGDDLVELCVADSGIGIPEEYLDDIFDRFTRVPSESDEKRGGTGLGLAIARGIVEAHGGGMRVDSVEGEGSRFFITLPAENDNDD